MEECANFISEYSRIATQRVVSYRTIGLVTVMSLLLAAPFKFATLELLLQLQHPFQNALLSDARISNECVYDSICHYRVIGNYRFSTNFHWLNNNNQSKIALLTLCIFTQKARIRAETSAMQTISIWGICDKKIDMIPIAIGIHHYIIEFIALNLFIYSCHFTTARNSVISLAPSCFTAKLRVEFGLGTAFFVCS